MKSPNCVAPKTLLLALFFQLLYANPLQAATDTESRDTESLLIEHVTVLSPERDSALTDQNVLIKNGLIVSISKANSSQHFPATIKRINGRGRFLTPGLMDSHVHVSNTPGLLPQMPGAAELHQAFAQQQPRSYLYFGVTQVLDTGNSVEGVSEFNAQPQKPDLFRCGAAPVMDGYPNHQLPKAKRYQQRPDFIVEAAHHHPLPAAVDAKQQTPEMVVARIAQSGADCLKIFIENGFGDADHLPVYSSDSLQRLRAAATNHGLPLLAHANAYDMQLQAVDGKVDVIAHGLWNWSGIDRNIRKQAEASNQLPAAIMQHLAKVHASGIGYQPTIQVISRMGALFEADALADPQLKKVVPKSLLDWYRTPEAQWFRDELQLDFGDMPMEQVAAVFKKASLQGAKAAKVLADLGHPLLLASDTPSSPTYTQQPGYSTYLEMQDMAAVGISPRAIFQAATINNAKMLNIAHKYGTVSMGKVANLLLLQKNPLENVQAWDSIEWVILHGEALPRAGLAAP
ncbi:amidohydrolase [Rheinheimera riviphila]|uniref:Amidohydrolase n=1 Tax=Rheinheimera riviphila TaxID=1834037 RepID=A0A437QG62_9GAMM|nr:amidohydrolase family protein [Rheinheimera riviphila]RVU33549.1 amidohydrolase [Rheinheimera riviphila]